MVIYTCIKNINTNYYQCYKGIKDHDNVHLEDFRMLSIPSSDLNFEIFRNIMDLQLLKYTLRAKVIIEE
jgi:hypothetical protein